jgi:TRAP-type C4-dicarboxylate transport system permease small subunit
LKFLVSALERQVEKLIALVLTLIVALIFSNVVGRYVLHASFAGAEELSRLLFVWLLFLGAIPTLRRGRTWAWPSFRRGSRDGRGEAALSSPIS